jgi:hypothetical protein
MFSNTPERQGESASRFYCERQACSHRAKMTFDELRLAEVTSSGVIDGSAFHF